MESSAGPAPKPPTPPAPSIGADDPSTLRQQQPAIVSGNGSPMFPASDARAATVTPRLLDSDPSKFRSLKRVIVFGRPGSGTDGISDALKELGFKVYDFQAASARYERDFPLWLEAARLREQGRPYNKSDFDKVIGDHDAIVAAPACFFNADFVKLYAGVKVILMTRDCGPDSTQKLFERTRSRFWQWADPVYLGNLHIFFTLTNTMMNNAGSSPSSDQAIREIVRERNLLEIKNFITWVTLCEFLGVKIPDAPAPEFHDCTIQAEVAARPRRWAVETAKKSSHYIAQGITRTLTMAYVTLVSTLAVLIGGFGLFKLSTLSSQLLMSLLVHSQIQDVTRVVAAGIAFCTLGCGFIAGYSLALMRKAEAPRVKPRPRNDHHENSNGQRRNIQGHSKWSDVGENARPARPTLAAWTGVQDNIRRDDAEMREEGRATLEEWRNGNHVTFYVTHKRTGAGQDVFSGPRKVLSVTEETM